MCARREHIFVISILTMFLFFFFLFYCELVNLLHTFRFLLLFPCRRRRLRRLLLLFFLTPYSQTFIFFEREFCRCTHRHTHRIQTRASEDFLLSVFFLLFSTAFFSLHLLSLNLSFQHVSRTHTHTHTRIRSNRRLRSFAKSSFLPLIFVGDVKRNS